MDNEKKCKDAMKNIYKCHIHVHNDRDFFNCVSKDLKNYIEQCEKIYENTKKDIQPKIS